MTDENATANETPMLIDALQSSLIAMNNTRRYLMREVRDAEHAQEIFGRQRDEIGERLQLAVGEIDRLSGEKARLHAVLFNRRRSALEVAQKFHAIYEGLAPEFGYETRTETRQFDADSQNGKLMVATCELVLTWLFDTKQA